MKSFVVFCAFLALSQAVPQTGFKNVVVNRDGSITEEQVLEGIVGNQLVKKMEIVNENVDLNGVKQQGLWKKQITPINAGFQSWNSVPQQWRIKQILANQVLAGRVPNTIKEALENKWEMNQQQTFNQKSALNQQAQYQQMKNIENQIRNNQVLAGRVPNTIEEVLENPWEMNQQQTFNQQSALNQQAQYQQMKNLENQIRNNQVLAGRVPNTIEEALENQWETNQQQSFNQQSQSARNNALLNQYQQIKNLPVWEQKQLLKNIDVQILVNQIRNNQVMAGRTPNTLKAVIEAQQVAQQSTLNRQTQFARNNAMLNQFQQIKNLPVWEQKQLLKNIEIQVLEKQIRNNQALAGRTSNTIEVALENQRQMNAELAMGQQVALNQQSQFAGNMLNQNQQWQQQQWRKNIASAIESARIQNAVQQQIQSENFYGQSPVEARNVWQFATAQQPIAQLY